MRRFWMAALAVWALAASASAADKPAVASGSSSAAPSARFAPPAEADVVVPPITLRSRTQTPRAPSDALSSVVVVFSQLGSGGGFLVSSDGYLLTNQHVVGNSKYVKVTFSDGKETLGEVVRADAGRDVALVKVDPHGRAPLALRRGRPTVGEGVVAIGSPTSDATQSSVTKATVLANRIYEGQSFIQTDVAATPGDSGGLLIDQKGAVLGLAGVGYAPSGEPVGVKLFIPIGEALSTLSLRSVTVRPRKAAAAKVVADMVGPPITLKTARRAPRSLAANVSSVATVIVASGTGSGFLVSSDGYLLTNEHVVHAVQRVKVKWSDGTETTGEVVRTNARRDVALVKVDPGGRAAIPLRATQPKVGEGVFAIGSPDGEVMQNTVTKGIVSANRLFEGQNFIQSDVAVTHGNSGGPLVDEKGAVLGLTDIGYLPDGQPVDINLFIPIGEALSVLALTAG